MIEVTKDILKKIYKERPKDSKKYDSGFLVVIGGSEFYSGSPALSAMAAFKSGVDMVRIIAPERAANIIASFSPNLAAYPLEGKWLDWQHIPTLLSIIEGAKVLARGNTAVVIGGGMGRSEETQRAILDFIEKVPVPVVIDADAIHAISKKKSIITSKISLITPHSYEFFILTGREIDKIPEREKIRIVQEEAAALQTTILLKGPTDIISDGEYVALNNTGTPYMTKGGTGDTLAGICGAFLARGIEPFTAAQAAAYINGKAGEIASRKLKESLTATDLIEAITQALE